MPDPRIEQYARVFVEQCLDIQPGWQVLIDGGVLARPLLEEICRQIARRDAYALLHPSWGGGAGGIPVAWLREASLERIAQPAPIPLRLFDEVDAVIGIS